MRKLRIFLAEIVAVPIILGWLFFRYPESFDTTVPWIALGVLWHLTWEFVLDPLRVRAANVLERAGRMTWIYAFLVGGLISLFYFYAIKSTMATLAKHHAMVETSEKHSPHNPGPILPPASSKPEPPEQDEEVIPAPPPRATAPSEAKTANAGNPSDPAKGAEKPPRLDDLFRQDLPYTMKVTFDDTGIQWGDGSVLPIKRQVYLDFQAKTQFVGFFIPSADQLSVTDKTYNACLRLVDVVERTMEDIRKQVAISGGYADEMNSVQDLTFSGRVLLYHEDFLSIVQKAEIIKSYKAKGYDVQFRGPDYLGNQVVAWHHQHDSKGKGR
jgi:hypothetical protein